MCCAIGVNGLQHLIGQAVPDVALDSTQGEVVNPSYVAGRVVYFIYPYTGKAGTADPENWDTIPGAHGSTPQALSFASMHDEFLKMQIRIFGVSLLSPQWQSDFAEFHHLPYALLSDAQGSFSQALCLPRFRTGGQDYLMRLTLLVVDSTICHVRFPVARPEEDANDCLKWLSEQL